MIVTHTLASIADLPTKLHLAMGVFDGVHIGHREVILRAVREAKEQGHLSGVLTFDPFPIQVLAPDRAPQRILANIDHKRELLAALGVDFMLVIPFDQEFAKYSAKGFLDDLTSSGHVTHISIGEDWKFGRGREGSLSYLKEYCQQSKILLSATAPIMHEGERISSTRIRQAVRDGSLEAANVMLGRPYSVFGQVIRGKQLGRTIGFPTANIDTQNELLPPYGVYLVRSHLHGEPVYGMANLGVRPSVDDGLAQTFEVHYFDFDQEIYEESVEVELLAYIRPEKKFENLDALKQQIKDDCQTGQSLIQNNQF